MDKLTAARRSANMSAIRSKNTKPELTVRKIVHSLGYRYRLHCSDLPGKPDLVFRRRRKVIFVHGCFWHLHPTKRCADARHPKSNLAYWEPKLLRNAQRDRQQVASLKRMGWKVMVIWDCEVGNADRLIDRIVRFLDDGRRA